MAVNRKITSLWYIITSGFSIYLLLIHYIGSALSRFASAVVLATDFFMRCYGFFSLSLSFFHFSAVLYATLRTMVYFHIVFFPHWVSYTYKIQLECYYSRFSCRSQSLFVLHQPFCVGHLNPYEYASWIFGPLVCCGKMSVFVVTL